MNVTRKDATIQNVGADEDFPGSFEVVLSTAAKDRDGDELAAEDWKQPLPDHITFDTDHGMTVASTVGSGVPSIEDGKLIVRGTYSSLPRAQDTRTLVKEGHIRTTSVAFMSEKTTKDGKSRTTRELLNGAFVAIPSNREAVVLAAKSIVAEDVKAGARNSAADMARVQAIYDHAVALGAVAPPTVIATASDGSKSIDATVVRLKAIEARLDEAVQSLTSGDDIPEPVQKALDLLANLEDDVSDLIEATDLVEPTEEPAPAAAEKAAPEAETDDGLDLQNRLTVIKTAAALAG